MLMGSGLGSSQGWLWDLGVTGSQEWHTGGKGGGMGGGLPQPPGKEGPSNSPSPEAGVNSILYPGLQALPLTLLLLLQGGHCGPLLPYLGTDHLRGRSQPSMVTHNPCGGTHTSCGCTEPHMGRHNPTQVCTSPCKHIQRYTGMQNPVWACTAPRECTQPCVDTSNPT